MSPILPSTSGGVSGGVSAAAAPPSFSPSAPSRERLAALLGSLAAAAAPVPTRTPEASLLRQLRARAEDAASLVPPHATGATRGVARLEEALGGAVRVAYALPLVQGEGGGRAREWERGTGIGTGIGIGIGTGRGKGKGRGNGKEKVRKGEVAVLEKSGRVRSFAGGGRFGRRSSVGDSLFYGDGSGGVEAFDGKLGKEGRRRSRSKRGGMRSKSIVLEMLGGGSSFDDTDHDDSIDDDDDDDEINTDHHSIRPDADKGGWRSSLVGRAPSDRAPRDRSSHSRVSALACRASFGVIVLPPGHAPSPAAASTSGRSFASVRSGRSMRSARSGASEAAASAASTPVSPVAAARARKAREQSVAARRLEELLLLVNSAAAQLRHEASNSRGGGVGLGGNGGGGSPGEDEEEEDEEEEEGEEEGGMTPSLMPSLMPSFKESRAGVAVGRGAGGKAEKGGEWVVAGVPPRPPAVVAEAEAVLKLGEAVFGDREGGVAVVAAIGEGLGAGEDGAVGVVARSRSALKRFCDGVLWVVADGGGAPRHAAWARSVRLVVGALRETGMGWAGVRKVLERAADDDVRRRGGGCGGVGFMQAALEALLEAARVRFARRRLLVVLEAVGGETVADGGPGNVVALFVEALADAHPASRLLLSSRDARVEHVASGGAVRFPLRASSNDAAEALFRAHSSVDCGASPLVEMIIARAERFPPAVALASRAVRFGPPQARATLAAEMPVAAAAVAEATAREAGLPSAFAKVLGRVLEMLDARMFSFETPVPSAKALPYGFTGMFLALAVLEPAAPMSLPVLMRLWRVTSRDAARGVVDIFLALGLATFGGGRLYVHKVHLAYCRARCVVDDAFPCEAVWNLRLLTQLALSPCVAPEAPDTDRGSPKSVIVSRTAATASISSSPNADDSVANILKKRAIAAHNCSRLLTVPDGVDPLAAGGPLANVTWRLLCGGGLDDSYFAAQLVRHLVRAVGGLSPAATLLSDFRYVDFKVGRYGLEAAKEDYRVLLREVDAARDKTAGPRRNASRGGCRISSGVRGAGGSSPAFAALEALRTDVDLVLRSLDLMPDDIVGSYGGSTLSVFGLQGPSRKDQASEATGDRGLANQLAGRLPASSLAKLRSARGPTVHHTSSVSAVSAGFVSQLRKSVFQHAQRPWLRPLTAHLEQASSGLERVIRLGTGTITAVCLSADGSVAVSGTVNGDLVVHDLASGRFLKEFRGHKSHIHSVSISDTLPRRIVSSSWDNCVRVWDLEAGKLLYAISEHTNQVFCTAVAANGSTVASGSMDKTVCVWRGSGEGLGVGAELDILEGHTDWVRSVAVSSTGDLVFSGSDDTTIRVWGVDPSDKSSMACYGLLRGHKSRVSCLTVTPDDSLLVSGSFDGSVRVWTLETAKLQQVFKAPQGVRVQSVAVPQGAIPCGVSTNGTRAPVAGTIVAGYDDGITRVWGLQRSTRRQVAEFGEGMMAGRLAVSNDGSKVVSCSLDGALRVWLPAHVAWGGDQMRNATLLSTPKPELHGRPISAMAANASGSLVASGSWDKEIRLWHVSTGRCERVLKGHAHAVTNLAFAEDGQHLVSGSRDETVRLFTIRDGHCGHTLVGHKAPIMCVATNYDASIVLSGCEDGVVRVWRAATDYVKDNPLRKYDVPVLSVALSANGSVAVAVSAGGACQLWSIPSGVVSAATCVSSIQFNFRFGPSTAKAVLAAYGLRRGLHVGGNKEQGPGGWTPPSEGCGLRSGVSGEEDVQTGADCYKCSPAKKGIGLEVQTAPLSLSPEGCCLDFQSDPPSVTPGVAPKKLFTSGSLEKKREAGSPGTSVTAPQPVTVAYMDSGMGRESRVWTPVFSNAVSGKKFVAAGLCSGSVAILELVE